MEVNMLSSLSVQADYGNMETGTNKDVQEIAAVFAAMMNQQSQLPMSMTESISFDNDNTIGSVKSLSAAEEAYERYGYKENYINEATETDFEEKFEEVSDELEEFEQKALDAISKEFGVEKEAILEVLDEMGLSVMDLLNSQNLVSFVMELTGLTTKEDLLLNESFLNIMNTMDSMKKELMKELDVTSEDLEQLVELMEQVDPEEAFGEKWISEIQQGTENGMADMEEVFERNTSTDSEKNASADANQQSGESFMTMTSNVNMVQSADSSQMGSYLNGNTMEIMEQIVEQVKINVTAEKNTMELQLNPEHLGKIHINISEENGIINAKFTATNELVKEALESQVATLRENLNQAGVKVDAIEVTVSSHKFESNLEQNHSREENEGAYQEEIVQKRRNLTINTLDELSGLMTEEEALVAQIMKDNGNSVDLTA